jgi:hypothetical protein
LHLQAAVFLNAQVHQDVGDGHCGDGAQMEPAVASGAKSNCTVSIFAAIPSPKAKVTQPLSVPAAPNGFMFGVLSIEATPL